MSIFDFLFKKPQKHTTAEGAATTSEETSGTTFEKRVEPQTLADVQLPDPRYKVSQEGFARDVKKARGLEPQLRTVETDGTTRATFTPQSDRQWVNKTEGGSRG